MKDMNIVSFLLFLWNWISSQFFLEFNLFPPPEGAFGQNIYPCYSWMEKFEKYLVQTSVYTSDRLFYWRNYWQALLPVTLNYLAWL